MDARNLASRHLLEKPVYSAFLDLVNEVFYSLETESSHILDVLDTDTMDDVFALDWLNFYGVSFKASDKIDRNALRRYRAVLRRRGEIAAIKYMLQSGGGLFLNSPVVVEVYPWYDCPPSVNEHPEDGVIYIKTSDRRIAAESDMVSKVTPAGYKYDLLFVYSTSKVDLRIEANALQIFQHQERDLNARNPVRPVQLTQTTDRTVIIPFRVSMEKSRLYDQSVSIPLDVLAAQIFQHQDRDVDLDSSVQVGVGQKERATFEKIWLHGATFHPYWFTGGAYKDGYSYFDLMRVPHEHYANIIKQEARDFNPGELVEISLEIDKDRSRSSAELVEIPIASSGGVISHSYDGMVGVSIEAGDLQVTEVVDKGSGVEFDKATFTPRWSTATAKRNDKTFRKLMDAPPEKYGGVERKQEGTEDGNSDS